MYLTFYSCHQIKFERNQTYGWRDTTFGEITSKPRPFMNINDIVTESIRDCLLIMGNLSPMYELHKHCVVDLQWLQTILDKIAITVSPFNLWIITEMQ